MAVPAAALPAPPASAPSVHFRAAPGGVVVLCLPPVQRFDALRIALRELFNESPGRFAGARVRVDLGAREMDLLELRRLLHLLKDEFEVEVVGLSCTHAQMQRMAERELKLKIVADPVEDSALAEAEAKGGRAPMDAGTEQPTEIVAPEGDEEEDAIEEPHGTRKLLVIDGHVRSGAAIRTSGDLHVYGDVNPGAHLVAGGDIVVFGALKGLAHAGNRDERAFVMAFDLRPTQVRIGKVIGLSPAEAPDRASRGVAPEVAYVVAGSIVIEPYRGRLPRPLPAPPSTKETP
jgi:septum site-determining protein MinC